MPERSPEGVAHLPQSRLLPMLLDVATALGGPACVWFGRAVAGVRQTPSGVVATLEADAQVHCLPMPFYPGSGCALPLPTCRHTLAADSRC